MTERVSLEDELRVAQELLFLVVNKVGPVVLNIAEARQTIVGDKMIDFDLDSDAGTMTVSVKEIASDVE